MPKLTKQEEKRFDKEFGYLKKYWDNRKHAHQHLANELALKSKEIENIVIKQIGSCDHPCERCETAREILKELNKLKSK